MKIGLCKVTYVPLRSAAPLVFVQRGNNSSHPVPIAICSLLDAGSDRACNSFILLSLSNLSSSFCRGQSFTRLGGLTQCVATGSGL